MSAPLSAPVDVMLGRGQATPGSTAEMVKRQKIGASAQDFEAAFLSQMLKPMFDSLPTDGPFGGGSAEGMWRSFLTDAIAKQTTKAGGIGVADAVQREMLKLQGLSSEGNVHGA